MSNDLTCPNCGGTNMKVCVIDSVGDRLHIMAFCAEGPSCKIFPVGSGMTRKNETFEKPATSMND